MKVTESFVIDEPAPVLWDFFEQIDRVARCVPGVEHVEVLDEENSRLRIAQSIGPMSTTLDVRMQITERVPPSSLRFTATGRSVKGAVGHVRATNVIELSEAGAAATRVSLAAEIALGGMIGSVGQKAVAKQAQKISRSFAQALQRELRGEAEPIASAGTQPVPTGGASGHGNSAAAGTEPDDGSGLGSSGTSIERRSRRHPALTHLLAAAGGAAVFASFAALARRLRTR